MDYRYLKAFEITAKHLSFSKAAEELMIAQSAVSRQIKLLEESIGDELIIRSSKKVLLTDKGKDLVLAIKQFAKSTEDITQNVEDRPISIGVLHGLLENWLIQIIADFRKNKSNNLEICIDSPSALKQGISEGKFDLIFSTDNIQNELVSSLKLFAEKHVLISKKAVTPKEVHQNPWIIYDDHDFLFQFYKKRSKDIVQVNSVTAMIKLVRQGVGLAIIPEHLLQGNERINRYPMKSSQVAGSIYMSSLSYKHLPAHLQDFTNRVKKACEKF